MIPAAPSCSGRSEGWRTGAEEYRRLRFFRSQPVLLLEKGFHTDGMTSYSVDGELLVPIPVGVSWGSGTNLDRKMELVRADLVKRIAGRGVSAEVDAEYARLKSLESGMRGSSRLASMKIDAVSGFQTLRQSYPFLSRLGGQGEVPGACPDRARVGPGDRAEADRVARAGRQGSQQRRCPAHMNRSNLSLEAWQTGQDSGGSSRAQR